MDSPKMADCPLYRWDSSFKRKRVLYIYPIFHFMKLTPPKSILLVTLALVTNATLFGQSKDAIMNNIRKQFQSINKDSSLRIIKLENEEFMGDEIGDGGGELKGYFKGDQILKVYTWLGVSNGVG